VPGAATLTSAEAEVDTVSCAAPGECVAGGYYEDGSDNFNAFVVDEKDGSWGSATEVPGTAALNGGGSATVSSVSCAAPGECAAGGDYTDGSGHGQVFVADEKDGRWDNAIEVRGTATGNGVNAYMGSVSCATAGNCSAGGSSTRAFVVDETNGRWSRAIGVSGNEVDSVSCAAPDECAASGTEGSTVHGFVVNSHAAGALLAWSRSRDGALVTSYDFGAVNGGSSVTRSFRLGNLGLTTSGKLAIGLTGSSAFSITSDRCTGKSIGKKLSCWVAIAYAPIGTPTSDSATLTATGTHGAAASLSLSGR
jgi:hypothetical protein